MLSRTREFLEIQKIGFPERNLFPMLFKKPEKNIFPELIKFELSNKGEKPMVWYGVGKEPLSRYVLIAFSCSVMVFSSILSECVGGHETLPGKPYASENPKISRNGEIQKREKGIMLYKIARNSEIQEGYFSMIVTCVGVDHLFERYCLPPKGHRPSPRRPLSGSGAQLKASRSRLGSWSVMSEAPGRGLEEIKRKRSWKDY